MTAHLDLRLISLIKDPSREDKRDVRKHRIWKNKNYSLDLSLDKGSVEVKALDRPN